MKLHTVFITHNRLELTKQAISSYLETVSVPYTFYVVDNASTDGTVEWLAQNWAALHRWMDFRVNRYPGCACNFGWGAAPEDATFLHRADNDFAFIPGWCEEVMRRFIDPRMGQVGLRTGAEENYVSVNVGGNCVIRRELWDKGLRWDERPWPQIREEVGPGYSEDSLFSEQVKKMGYLWTRVKRPCIRSLASGDWGDPYYQRSYGDRGIVPRPDDPTAPGTE